MADRPVVIVTGASHGMGADVARWLGKIGASVTLVARSSQNLEKIAEDVRRLGGRAFPFSADVAGQRACFMAARETIRQYDRIDALVNNAGIIGPIVPIADMNPHAWSYNIEVNLYGPFYMAQSCIPDLRESRGRIINVSSGAAQKPIKAWSAYCTAKAGLTHLTRVLALEEPDLTTVSFRPGVVDTQMQHRIRAEGDGKMDEEKINYFKGLKAERKLEPPRVPARSLAWLALHAPNQWSGEFINYDDPKVAEPALEMFGETFE